MSQESELGAALGRLSSPQRQSPLAVVFLAGRMLRRLGLAQLALVGVAVSTQARNLGGVAAVLPLIALAFAGIGYVAWLRYTFAVVDGELRVTKGVLSEERLSIPLDRIQSVSIRQPLVQRVLGLVSLSVDTAGTAVTELEIHAVTRRVADDLALVARNSSERRSGSTAVARDATSSGGQAPGTHRGLGRSPGAGPGSLVGSAPGPGTSLDAGPGPGHETGAGDTLELEHRTRAVEGFSEETLIRHRPERLVRTAISRVPLAGLALLAPLFAGADEVAGVIGIDPSDLDQPTVPDWQIVALVVVAPFVLVALGVGLNVGRELFTNWDLTVVSSPKGLRRSAGLTSRTSTSSSVARIQQYSTAQNLLERRFGLRRLAMQTVGGGGSMSIPGCDSVDTQVIEQLLFGERPLVLDQTTSSAEVFRSVRNAVPLVVIVVAVGWYSLGWQAVLGLLVLVLRWLKERREVSLRRWGTNGESIAVSDTFVTTRVQRSLLHKTNTAAVRQSRFERRRGLATVEVSAAGTSIVIGMIPLADAQRIRDLALFAAETDARPWM